MKTLEQLENEVRSYCERHNIQIKSLYSFNNIIEVEAFSCDWLKAKITEKGRTVFTHNDKRTSLNK